MVMLADVSVNTGLRATQILAMPAESILRKWLGQGIWYLIISANGQYFNKP
jgi:hypothetical protein